MNTGRRPCPFDVPNYGSSEQTPFDLAHNTAAALSYDAQRIEGIGGTERPTEDQLHNLISDAKRLAKHADDILKLAVWTARDNGMSWSEIGARFGISRQAAQQRFGSVGGRR